MKATYYNPLDWKNIIPDIETIIERLEKTPIIGVGMTPYSKAIPGLFLKNYSIYTIHDSCDVTALRKHVKTFVLADKYPDLALKVHGTGYLTGSYAFQGFLKSIHPSPILFLGNTTQKITSDLEKIGVSSIGNLPESSKHVELKGDFRKLLRELNLPSLTSKIYNREDLHTITFQNLIEEFDGPCVAQRADKEVGCNEGTFFVHTEEDWIRTQRILTDDTTYSSVVISTFVKGLSTSMLGCVTKKGILSGPLQLQLIDVPESLRGTNPNGAFYGNDIGFKSWDSSIEESATHVVESIGKHLQENGYFGVFGIDFLYDEEKNRIFANECNARFTGSLTLYSLTLLHAGLPPFEFFHILEHLGIESSYDFEHVKSKLKLRSAYSHIALSPKNILSMEVPLQTGIYTYDPEIPLLTYEGTAITLDEIQNKNQFLLIDTVQKVGQKIEQGVPRLFKLIFPRSIGISSNKIDTDSAFLIKQFSNSLIQASKDKNAIDV
jgi:hypothetical protein